MGQENDTAATRKTLLQLCVEIEARLRSEAAGDKWWEDLEHIMRKFESARVRAGYETVKGHPGMFIVKLRPGWKPQDIPAFCRVLPSVKWGAMFYSSDPSQPVLRRTVCELHCDASNGGHFHNHHSRESALKAATQWRIAIESRAPENGKPGPEFSKRSDAKDSYFKVWAFLQKPGNAETAQAEISRRTGVNKDMVKRICKETRPPTAEEIKEHRKQAKKK